MREAETIRRLLTARQVAEFYGFHADRAGNISCPFHRGDRTPSLKLYDGEGGFHCFGCGAHGSVIDFVMKLFDLNFRQAVMRLDSDFNLGLSRQKQQFSDYSAAVEKRRAEIRAKEREEREFWQAVHDLWYFREAKELFEPVQTDDGIWFHPLYVEAVKMIPHLENWIDEHIAIGGDNIERNSALHAG